MVLFPKGFFHHVLILESKSYNTWTMTCLKQQKQRPTKLSHIAISVKD